MQIILENNYGRFIIGKNGDAKLLNISGLGIPQKEIQTVTYSGQAGQTTLSMRDMPRAITITMDFYGSQDEILKLYRMIYHNVDIIILSGNIRRKITGLCINQSDIESIIYHKMCKAAFQFVCDDPYFHDITETKVVLNRRTDKLPNLYENSKYYVNLPTIATERTNAAGVINNGAANVYPIIEIYNNTPDVVSDTETGLIISSNVIESKITIDRDMKPSEKITIDLPNRKIISNVDGNIINDISDDTKLSDFFLIPGNNYITVKNKNSQQDTMTIIRFNNNYEAAVI